MNDDTKGIIALIVYYTLFFGGLGYLVLTCNQETVKNERSLSKINCEYSTGQLIQSKISGSIGQIVKERRSISSKTCCYDVRFPGLQVFTNTHIFSDDEFLTVYPFQIMPCMAPYELKLIKDRENE